MTTFFKIIPHHSPPNPSGAAVCPAAISVPKPVQGAAQVGTRNRIPGGNSGCCAFPWKLPVCCFFYDNSSHKQKQKSRLWRFFLKCFCWHFFTYLSFWGLLFFFSEPEPLPCLTHWTSISSATVSDAILLHPSLLQANSRSHQLVQALDHSRSSMIPGSIFFL